MRTCCGEVVNMSVTLELLPGIIIWIICPGDTKEQLNTDAWSWFEEERRGWSKCIK